MNNFEIVRNKLWEDADGGLDVKDSKKAYTREEAAKLFKLKPQDVIFSDGVIKGHGVWYNDDTGEAVLAKESPKQILGKFAKKRL